MELYRMRVLGWVCKKMGCWPLSLLLPSGKVQKEQVPLEALALELTLLEFVWWYPSCTPSAPKLKKRCSGKHSGLLYTAPRSGLGNFLRGWVKRVQTTHEQVRAGLKHGASVFGPSIARTSSHWCRQHCEAQKLPLKPDCFLSGMRSR